MSEKETVFSSNLKYAGIFPFSDLYNFCYTWLTEEAGLDILEDKYEEKLGLTNNQAEYSAIIVALKKFQNFSDEVVIFSDSKNTVNQLNHEFAINNERLRDLAREAWVMMGKFSNLSIQWIPRKENMAGKMLGS